MRRNLLPLVLVLVGALLIAPAALAKGPQPGGGSDLLTAPVTGTFTDALGGTGTFAGEFILSSVTARGGSLEGVGTLSGTLTDSVGTTVGSVTQQVTLPLDVSGTCDVLELTLGPLDLDLLGLVVHLDTVHLEIDAEAAPGNLLGNLLCAVVGLLDGGLSLNILADLLNVIIDVINDLGL